MPERFDGGRALIAIGAIALLVSLFLEWYGSGDQGFGAEVSAWTAFELLDIVLAALALAALAGVADRALPSAGLPSVSGSALALAGPIVLVLVLVSLVDEPPAVRGADPETGIWIALAAGALMSVGTLLSIARVSLVISVREREPRPGGATTTDSPEYGSPAPDSGERPTEPLRPGPR